MTWTYHQSTGDLFHDGVFIGTGYSGAGTTRAEGRNNGDMQGVSNEGPIPRGMWTIGRQRTDPKMGSIAMPLTPVSSSTALGRSGFFIHGNNQANNASEGCVILANGIRSAISRSTDKSFEVVA